MKLDADEPDDRFKCIRVILLNEHGEERTMTEIEKDVLIKLVMR